MKEYLIIPGCCDLNRGDQALGWETRRIAEEAGFVGKYYILAEKNEPVNQSVEQNFDVIIPILQHPTRNLKKRNNIHYSFFLKIKLFLIAFFDFIYSIGLITPLIKNIFYFFSFGKNKKCLKVFSKVNAVFMKGGGLIQSHGGLTSTYATYYRLYNIFLAHSLKKEIYVMPNSFGPFDGPFVKFMVKKAFSYCKLVTSREKKSTEYVKKMLNIDIDTYPDLGFFLKNGNLCKNDFAKKYNLSLEKKWVAVTARPYRFPNSKNPEKLYNNYIKSIASFVKYLAKNGYIVLLIEHTFATTEHENDRKALNDIILYLNKNDYTFISNPEYNCYDLKCVYSFCDYIIGTRFHSMIFSLSNKIPGIAISYDGNKSTGIMRDIGLDKYVVDIYDINYNMLKKMFESINENKLYIVNKIEKYLDFINNQRKLLISEMEKKR